MKSRILSRTHTTGSIMAAMFTFNPQPYQLDIAVTWECRPSRTEYLAAKMRAWTRDAAIDAISQASRDSVSVSDSQSTSPHERNVHCERPFASPTDSGTLRTLVQRWCFFRELATTEMEWHGLTRQSWTVKFDHARARAGQCQHRAKVLSFSRHLIARGSPADMRNTLLHEIAHALAGPRHGHDQTWRTIALQIGCDGQRCHSMELAPAKWIYRCSAGCWAMSRFKRSRCSAASAARCRKCHAACVFVCG